MNKERVGYTTGVFDLFHVGHLRLLQRAKSRCDRLIVGVSTDDLVESYKNKRPVIPFEERIEIVAALKCVDEVIPQTHRDKIAAYHEIKFDVMFVGSDWKGSDLFNKVEAELAAKEEKKAKSAGSGMFDADSLVDQIGNPDFSRILMAAALAGVVNKYDLKGQTMGDVVLGAVIKHSRDFNLARESLLDSGLSPRSPGLDLQRLNRIVADPGEIRFEGNRHDRNAGSCRKLDAEGVESAGVERDTACVLREDEELRIGGEVV